MDWIQYVLLGIGTIFSFFGRRWTMTQKDIYRMELIDKTVEGLLEYLQFEKKLNLWNDLDMIKDTVFSELRKLTKNENVIERAFVHHLLLQREKVNSHKRLQNIK